MNRKVTAGFLRACGGIGRVPTIGISAIDVAQPPSASADSNSNPTANALVFRSTGTGLEVPTSPTPSFAA